MDHKIDFSSQDWLQQRTYARVDLSALRNNYRSYKPYMGSETGFIAVIKSDAYGHGAVPCAQVAIEEGATMLAVAALSEAVILREAGIREIPLLILGYTDPNLTEYLLAYDLIQTVIDSGSGLEYAKQATKIGKKLTVHIKLDTGMTRIGFSTVPQELKASADEIVGLKNQESLILEGLFTHLATAESDPAYATFQYQSYQRMNKELTERGVGFRYRHVCNSAGMILYPDMQLDLVRPGITQFGSYPTDAFKKLLPLRPVMNLYSRVVQTRNVDTGTGVSYSLRWKAPGPSKLAVIPIGYADGLHRLLSNRASFLINGKLAPVVGSICMDRCMVDITDIPETKVGDRVLIFGADETGSIPVETVAQQAETISYEILCAVSPRVMRVYVDGK
ncbi:MAG TPA: alanine racemase [Clostridiaceae bacterium]|nr:alanine racemase [Clostridiaceae bacterium]